MNDPTLTKNQAADLFDGTYISIARAIGVSRAAIGHWPDVLTVRQTDEVIGAAVRLGKIKSDLHPEIFKQKRTDDAASIRAEVMAILDRLK